MEVTNVMLPLLYLGDASRINLIITLRISSTSCLGCFSDLDGMGLERL